MRSLDISQLDPELIPSVYETLPHMNNNIDVLFHYTNIHGLKGIIESNKFWVSHAHFLNDKTEINYTLELSNKVFKEFCENLPEKIEVMSGALVLSKQEAIKDLTKYYDVITNAVFNDSNYSIYALSFCTNSDSNLLWSNYSNNDGYLIKINFLKFRDCLREKTEHKEHIHAGLVIYDMELQKKLLTKLFEFLLRVIKNILYQSVTLSVDQRSVDPADALTYVHYTLTQYSIFFKDQCFSQEEELRIAITLSSNFDNYKCRVSNGAFIPYIEVDFEKDCVEGITVGPKNNMDITINGLKHFLILNKYNHIKDESILKSRIPYRY
ncbi:DUF2971 domain-containing protein [Bacillus velezensis]|uniref:DUF2971 domain-containing protein n=1 Tax=Bacillus velezensis TaxID=492670 RepID=UPI000F600599|nr:DUF2971 domain-containing protein [Bacillus velezensis]AZI47257.1 DUF2971 domain-containing protein [Bacillus velezensis]MEC1905524.1 DUF2971 domain-containing protein [Bacillus velezensis]